MTAWKYSPSGNQPSVAVANLDVEWGTSPLVVNYQASTRMTQMAVSRIGSGILAMGPPTAIPMAPMFSRPPILVSQKCLM